MAAIKNQRQCCYCDNQLQYIRKTEYDGDFSYHTLACEHTIAERIIKQVDLYDTIVSNDGKKPFKFQIDTIKFAEKAQLRCLIGHEMGLGKTVCADGIVKLHPECFPVVLVAKAGIVTQHFLEMRRWTDNIFQLITSGKEKPYPGMKGYIVTYDLVGKMDWSTVKPNTLILDECQHIKNSAAKRTNNVRELAKNVKYFIATSGTPIKNNMSEYFPVLNMLRPDLFPSQERFVRDWCEIYSDGYSTKIGGIKPYREKAFRELTSDFIIRYTRDEVMPDLPKIFRKFAYADLGEDVKKAYQHQMDGFLSAMEDLEVSSGQEKFAAWNNILQYMTKMRHLAGLAKIDPVVDMTADYLFDNNRKLTLFVHHKDVGEILFRNISKICSDGGFAPPVRLTSDMDIEQRAKVVQKFVDDPSCRILIASTLASGEGLNLQICSDCIMVERQWNPANEEQAEARFSRIGSAASQINATYFTALSTIDEFFTELVEKKRAIMGQVLDGQDGLKWDESNLMQELAQALRTKGKEKWKLRK